MTQWKMNNREIRNTERLVRRFFDGETTLAEERRLYRLFSRKGLPQELEKYRPVFAAFGSMQADEGRRARLVPVFRRAVCGVAAAVLLLLGVWTYIDYREDKALARLYGGSYVIENGVRTDDLGRIRGDIEQALADAERVEKRVGQGSVADRAEADVLRSIDDPELRRQVEDMLN